jgi:flagellar motor switch protein FliG
LATAKPKLTLLALKGASPQLLERVLKMLPRAEAKEVQFRIQNLGPTRIQDIQRAQTYLLRLATLLEDAGRFKQPRRRAG